MSIKKKTAYFGLAILCSMLLVVMTAMHVSAVASMPDAMNKMYAYQARDCFENSATDVIDINSYLAIGGGWNGIFPSSDVSVDLPTTNGSSVRHFADCANFISTAYNTEKPPTNMESVEEFDRLMSQIGYTKDGSADGFAMTYTIPFTDGQSLSIECSGLDQSGRVTSATSCWGGNDGVPLEITYKRGTLKYSTCSTTDCKGENKIKGSIDVDKRNMTVMAALEEITTSLGTGQGYCIKNAEECTKLSGTGQATRVTGEYVYKKSKNGANTFQAYVSGITGGYSALKLSPSEREALAWDYLKNYYQIEYYGNDNCDLSEEQKKAAVKAGYKAVNLGKPSTCYVRPSGGQDKGTIPGWTKDGYPTGFDMTFDSLIDVIGDAVTDNQNDAKETCRKKAEARLKELQEAHNRTSNSQDRDAITAGIRTITQMLNNNSYVKTDSSGTMTCASLPTITGGETSGDTVYNPSDRDNAILEGAESGEVGTYDGCFSEAGVLGWILCPVLRIVGVGLEGIYNDIENQYFVIDTDTVGKLDESWGKFRNYANIIFAIAFVIVILSQITGIGLSNYNIKKMLPRLLVIVILVNLSFVLCEIAVDLSNILGYSFRHFFDNLSTGVGGELPNFATSLNNSIKGIGLTAGAGAALYFTVQAGGWAPILIALLAAAVSALIGVMFFYIILGVRQAAVIILLVLSPLAIASYALPNTQNLFKKWLKLFGDMLLVYPICGLLMGAGNWISRLLLDANTNGGFMYYLVATLIPVASFFFIPTILRSSVNGIAGLGNKIQGIGRHAGMRTAMRVRRSQWAQEHLEESRRNAGIRQNTRRAMAMQEALKRTDLSDRQRKRYGRRLSRANAFLKSAREEDLRNSLSDQKAYIADNHNLEYDRATSRIDQEQFVREVDGQVEAFKHDDSFNNQDMKFLRTQHAAALQEVYNNKDDRNAQIRAAAIEKTMMKLRADDGATAITDNYNRFLERGLVNGGQAGAQEVSNRIGKSAARFMDENGGVVKQTMGKSTAATMSDIASGESYGDYSSDSIVRYTDDKGADHFYNKNKIAEDVKKLTARDFENFSDSKFDTLSTAISNGDIKDDAAISRIMEAASDFQNNPTINKKNSSLVDNLVKSAATRGAIPHSQIGANGTVINTTGSHAFNNASASMLNSLASQITNKEISDADAARLTSNLSLAAQNGNVMHSEEWVDAANNIMAAAHARGIGQLNSAGGLSSSVVSDHVDATNVRFNQDYAPVHVDPSLSTASNEDVRVAVESAQAQFKQQAKYHDLNVATEKDVQDALLRARILNPSATVNSLGFKAGDVVKKVDAGGGTYNYSTVNSALAEEYRTGLKNSAKINFKAGDVIQRGVDNNGIATYNRAADAVAEEYRAALKHNSEIKIQQERRNQKYQPTPPPPTPTP